MKNVLMMMGALTALLLACGGSGSGATAPDVAGRPNGSKIFRTHCTLCHGNDGRLGINGAKDLSASTLSRAEMIALVSNGRGAMAPYRQVLTKAEIEAVVDHLRSLHPEE